MCRRGNIFRLIYSKTREKLLICKFKLCTFRQSFFSWVIGLFDCDVWKICFFNYLYFCIIYRYSTENSFKHFW